MRKYRDVRIGSNLLAVRQIETGRVCAVVQWISTCSAANVNIGQVCSALFRYTEQHRSDSRALEPVHMHRLVNLTPVILGVAAQGHLAT